MTAPSFNPPPKPSPAPDTRTCPTCRGSEVERWLFLGQIYAWTCQECKGSEVVPAQEESR